MTARAIPLRSSRITAQFDEGVGRLTIDNPTRRNAVSLDMWEALGDAALALENEAAVRVVVISGAGGNAFASGAEISELSALRADAETASRYAEAISRTHAALRGLSKPLVAMIEGHCHGAGLGIALTADVRFATPDSKFSVPAARLGIGYDENGFSALARAVGTSVAKDLLFSARTMDADEALRTQLVNFMVSREEIRAVVSDYVRRVALNAPLSVRAAKATAAAFDDPSDPARALHAAALIKACRQSRDFVQGQDAFAQKRTPDFTGE